MYQHGQIWKNGRYALKVEKNGGEEYKCLLFTISKGENLRFDSVQSLDNQELSSLIERRNMSLTDKSLVLAEA